MENKFEKIPKELFEFVQLDAVLHDKKMETKARGFFADAFLRFKKNKSSVVAAWIIGLLVLFAILSPIVSSYTIKDKDVIYQNYPPYVEKMAKKGYNFLNGGKVLTSQNEQSLDKWHAIGKETGMDPVLAILGTEEVESKYRGQIRVTKYYKLKLNHGDLKATQGDTGHAEIDMITKVYAHILDEDRKINAQKFESAFYANPDLRKVTPPQEQPPVQTVDLAALIEQLQKSPELASTLAALIAGQKAV